MPLRQDLPHVDVTHDRVSGRVYQLGATVTDWRPEGQAPVLFTSSKAVFDGVAAIRGGIPICTPWFGAHPTDAQAPQHGLVRTAKWELLDETESRDGVTVKLGLVLPGLDLRYRVGFGSELRLSLKITNTGSEDRRIEAALHTYLSLSDVHAVSVTGLEHVAYLDKVNGTQRCEPAHAPIRFTEETDRVYLDTKDDVVLHDPGLERKITVHKQGGRSTVVWNPWVAKAARMADFGDGDYQTMCCIESAAVGDDAWNIEPGDHQTLSATLRVDPA